MLLLRGHRKVENGQRHEMNAVEQYSLIGIPDAFRANHLPQHGKALVKSKLFPHLEALFASKGATFNKSMYASVVEAIFVPVVVKSTRNEHNGASGI